MANSTSILLNPINRFSKPLHHYIIRSKTAFLRILIWTRWPEKNLQQNPCVVLAILYWSTWGKLSRKLSRSTHNRQQVPEHMRTTQHTGCILFLIGQFRGLSIKHYDSLVGLTGTLKQNPYVTLEVLPILWKVLECLSGKNKGQQSKWSVVFAFVLRTPLQKWKYSYIIAV